MSIREISKSVESIESEAEKILEEARTRANEILLKAKVEAQEILSSQLPMDETEKKCQEIIHNANIEADKKSKDAANKASEIGTNADKKIEEVVERIVNIIIGAQLT
jgi:vacuolar-type H+-ATPase subunit H